MATRGCRKVTTMASSSSFSITSNGIATTHLFSKSPNTNGTITTTTQYLKPENNHSTTAAAAYTPATENERKTLKSRAASGETLYGLFLMTASPTIAEIVGLAGYDFVVVDMEHGSGGISEALSCVRALSATGTPAIIRVPEKSAAWAKKALDLGPQGIMFPMIENGKMAEQVVSYCRYPPQGIRGTAHVMVRASGYGTDESYVHRCEEELLILCMVETETGVDNIEAIAAVDGVDGIQMGPRDLGASMGYLKDPGNGRVREVLLAAERRVLAVQKPGRGPFLGGIATQHHKPEDMRKRGYQLVAGGADVGMFRQAAVEDVKSFRRGGAAPPRKVAQNKKHGDVPSAA